MDPHIHRSDWVLRVETAVKPIKVTLLSYRSNHPGICAHRGLRLSRVTRHKITQTNKAYGTVETNWRSTLTTITYRVINMLLGILTVTGTIVVMGNYNTELPSRHQHRFELDTRGNILVDMMLRHNLVAVEALSMCTGAKFSNLPFNSYVKHSYIIYWSMQTT